MSVFREEITFHWRASFCWQNRALSRLMVSTRMLSMVLLGRQDPQVPATDLPAQQARPVLLLQVPQARLALLGQQAKLGRQVLQLLVPQVRPVLQLRTLRT